jgi:hypothetical protein
VSLFERVLRAAFPNQDITHAGSVYLRRFLLTPSIGGWRLMLHKICRPDLDRVLHDHPWDFATICLCGGYVESVLRSDGSVSAEVLIAGEARLRSSGHTHRIDRILGDAAWTLVLHGPRRRKWGFWNVVRMPATFTVAADYFTPEYDQAAPPARKRWSATAT